MNFKTLALATLATISAGADAVTVVDLDDVSFKAEEIRGSLFAASTTSTSSTVRQDAPTNSAITAPVKPVERIAVSSAQTVQRTFGSFPAPSIFPITQPTLSGSAFPWFALQQERNRPRRLAVNVPYWVPHKKQIVIPNARIDGQYHEGINLELQPDGTFKQLYTSTPMNKADISAANYRAGVLTLTSLMVGDIRFSNVRFELRPNGNLEIVDAYFPNEVKRSSAENYQGLPFGAQRLPIVRGKHSSSGMPAARAFADFTQTGEFSYFGVAQQNYLSSVNPKEPSTFAFFRSIRGQWVDVTSSLVRRDTNTGMIPVGCVAPRQAIVSDFNGDEQPDIFVACHGSERPEVPHSERNEPGMLFMSGLDGLYTVSRPMVTNGNIHSVAAYDFSGKGFADIIAADMDLWDTPQQTAVYFLKNNGNGTFARDYSQTESIFRWKFAFNVDVVKTENKLYLYASGPDTEYYGQREGLNASFYEMTNDGRISSTPAHVIPSLESQTERSCQSCYNHNLAISVENNKARIIKVTPEYTNYALIEYDFSTRKAEYIHIHNGELMRQYAPGKPEVVECESIGTTWIDFIRVHDDKIVTDPVCTSPNVKLN